MRGPYVPEKDRTVAVAKHQLVDYCEGDKTEAAAVWAECPPAHDPVTDREWVALVDRAARRRRGTR